MRKVVAACLVVLAFLMAGFFSLYRITESPPPWRDEGVVTQVARNVVEEGKYGVQIAPGEFVSAGFVTIGYPVIYPIALSFSLFGEGLLQARAVMVGFIFLLLISAYCLIKKESNDPLLAALTLLLLSSFAPLFGHGRTAIGEVPGTALLLLLLWLIRRQEGKPPAPRLLIFGIGMFFGLVMATKPIFLMMLIPTLFVGFVFFRPRQITAGGYAWFIAGSLIPLWLWFALHFHGDSIGNILSIYSGNPERISLTSIVVKNIRDFFTHLETLYFGGLMGAWLAGACFALRRKVRLSLSEKIALTFALFLSGAYFATVGYYRYFFPAEVLALAYFPLSLERLLHGIPISGMWMKRGMAAAIVGLAMFQTYETGFRSFISDYFQSNRTELLSGYARSISHDKAVLVYNVPEAVLFLPTNNYYQYARFAETERGGGQLNFLLSRKIPDEIIIHSGDFENRPEVTEAYAPKINLGKYDVLIRR